MFFIIDIGELRLMAAMLDFDKHPKVDGETVTFHDRGTVDASSRVHHEAIVDGEVVASGKCFNIGVSKGTVATFRKIKPRRDDYSKEEIESNRGQVKETVIDQGQFDGGPVCFGGLYDDGSLDDVIGSFVAIRESIPEHYRETARCEIYSDIFYDSNHARVRINYMRPETDEEVVERLQQDDIAKMLKERTERAQLERLKEKYAET